MSSPSADSNITQSIRSSCDRCRLKKLKCIVTTESDAPAPCERCRRAKVPCFFGRRRRAHRTSDARRRPTLATRESRSPDLPIQQTLPAPSPTSASTLAAPHAQLTGLEVVEFEETAAYGAQPWESLTLGLTNAPENILGQEDGIVGWEWLHDGFSLANTCGMDADTLDLTMQSPSPVFSAPGQAGGSTVTSTGSAKLSNSVLRQRLFSLIGDIQDCLKTLEEGPWQNDGSRSLDDYPVGAVLHLLQEFNTIAGPILDSTRGSNIMMDRNQLPAIAVCGDTQAAATDDAALGTEVDTATVLLIFCGHIWLMRIYSTVLGHFQRHLDSMPPRRNSTTSHGGETSSSSTRPPIQLGDLPCASAAPDIGRIHTAVSMLLTALQDVEERLGQGGRVARNLVVTKLEQETLLAGELQDGCGGLGRKVSSVKGLLREKMDL